MKYTSQHCCDKTINGKNGLLWRLLFSELHIIMVNEVTFEGYRGPITPTAPPWIRPWQRGIAVNNKATGKKQCI